MLENRIHKKSKLTHNQMSLTWMILWRKSQLYPKVASNTKIDGFEILNLCNSIELLTKTKVTLENVIALDEVRLWRKSITFLPSRDQSWEWHRKIREVLLGSGRNVTFSRLHLVYLMSCISCPSFRGERRIKDTKMDKKLCGCKDVDLDSA